MLLPPQHPVPVFPLPGLVMFPCAFVPLHIFELRYRTMVRDALSRGRIIMLALLKPGWEDEYHGNPEFFEMGCLVRFEQVEWLPNDCYDLKVKGLSRARVQRIVDEFPYRSARLELVPQAPYDEEDPLTLSEKHALAETFQRWLGAMAGQGELAEVTIPDHYETLVNTMCMAAETSAQQKLELLELDSIMERGRRVRALVEDWLRTRGKGKA